MIKKMIRIPALNRVVPTNGKNNVNFPSDDFIFALVDYIQMNKNYNFEGLTG